MAKHLTNYESYPIIIMYGGEHPPTLKAKEATMLSNIKYYIFGAVLVVLAADAVFGLQALAWAQLTDIVRGF